MKLCDTAQSIQVQYNNLRHNLSELKKTKDQEDKIGEEALQPSVSELTHDEALSLENLTREESASMLESVASSLGAESDAALSDVIREAQLESYKLARELSVHLAKCKNCG